MHYFGSFRYCCLIFMVPISCSILQITEVFCYFIVQLFYVSANRLATIVLLFTILFVIFHLMQMAVSNLVLPDYSFFSLLVFVCTNPCDLFVTWPVFYIFVAIYLFCFINIRILTFGTAYFVAVWILHSLKASSCRFYTCLLHIVRACFSDSPTQLFDRFMFTFILYYGILSDLHLLFKLCDFILRQFFVVQC